MTSERPGRRFYGWYIAGTCLLIYFFTNGMALFVPQNLFPRFMETFNATEGEVSLTTGLMFGLTAILAPFAGVLIDRFGPLRILRIGICIMAVCFAAYPFAQSLTQLYVLHTGLAFGLVLGGLLANVVLLSNWFIRRRGAVIGLLTAMSSLGGLILPNLISPLVNDPQLGWRWGIGALAIAFWALALIPGFLILKQHPADINLAPDGGRLTNLPSANNQTLPDGVTFSTALHSRTLWVLAIGSTCLWFTFQAINSQITIFLELEAGLTPQNATRLYTMIFGFSVAGKFLFGVLSDRITKRTVMRITSAVLLAGCLCLFTFNGAGIGLTTNPMQLTVFTIVFGLGYGGSFTMIQLVCVESFGQQALGKVLGIIMCVDSIGGMLGTILTGQLKTTTGSYLIPFAIVAVVTFVALINILLIRPVEPTRQGSDTAPNRIHPTP
ncbi:MAG TPA: MFS transporter [Gammaproteobacteria bacterium]|nr:MFS transporter [Gammaproteobacteria bacterium]MDP7152876.1 MFS transporter [Gammaproteobacteria bacterium]MDP7296015.1 MFS transporter [Gammaproteobacteria bacterium]MDP7659839.1 MFS transporter [Gammaproteobacteria bacterium]HJP37863.1 MFS transporter [Gammaproteobacteria bacterium]